MPNPFPGMDPYLEEDLWFSVHTDLCEEIARQLSPKLRPKYVALSTRRVVIAPPDNGTPGQPGDRYPDVGVLATGAASLPASAGVSTVPLVMPADLPEPIPHLGVEIRDVRGRQLVACIEVLSPTNKRGSGREEYAIRRLEILSRTVHFLEIDLLRAGVRFPTAGPLPDAPYFIFLSRWENRKEVTVWPILLEQPLPTVLVPLLPNDPEVPLDLQQALTTIYDIFGYDELMDYSGLPSGPLTAEQGKWIEEQLGRSGKRTPSN